MTAHELLTDEGACTHFHVEADFDDGDVENGPGTWGHDECDVYESDSHVIVLRRGLLLDVELIDWDHVRWCEQMEASQ